MGAELDVAEAVGELVCRACRFGVVVPERPREERLDPERRVVGRQLDCALDPAVHELVARPAEPHAGPLHGLERELGVGVAGRIAERDRVLKGSLEGFAVVLERARTA